MAHEKTAVLLDVDGTLVDTNYGHTVAWWRALRDADVVTPMWRLHRLIGMGADQLIEAVVGEERPELEESWSSHFQPFKAEAVALPGARDLVRELSERGATVLLATSGKSDDVEHLRKVIDADEWIDDAVNSGEVDASKPAPDIFALALDRAGVDAGRAVVVGDTVWDVKAADACGLRCIGVLTGGISRAELADAGAVEVYEDAAELARRLDDSVIGALLRT